MRPILFYFRGIPVRAYPASLFVGLTLGIVAGTIAGQAAGLDTMRLYLALVLLTIPALVGSRLLYALTHWSTYREQPSLLFSRDTGGAALYGGLLLALACSIPVLHWLDLSFGGFWDAATITLLVGMVFTKIGCLLNGCCAGRPANGWLSMNLPNAAGAWSRRVPSQLLECALAAALLLGAMSWAHRPFAGALFLAALTIYGAARIPLGATRESVDRVAGVSVFAAISTILLIGSAATFAMLWLQK